MLLSLNGHTDIVCALTVLQNGDLASGSGDSTIKLWNPIDGTLKRWNICFIKINGHNDYVFALTVLQNGDLASGSDTTIKIWST